MQASSEVALYSPNTWEAFAEEYGLNDGPLFAIGFHVHWRNTLARFIQGSKIVHVGREDNIPKHAIVLVWGSRPLNRLPSNCRVIRLEDGFLRSVGLGAQFARPLSWVVDFDHLYFDATGASRLERLLNDEKPTSEQRARAGRLIEKIARSGLTKYNTGHSQWQRPKDIHRVILVPGQVESDASIRLGSPAINTNLDLLKTVREENSSAWIVYKPHPDVLAGARKLGKDEKDAAGWCDEVLTDVPMDALLEQVDEVHTLTSLAGFEALLRNKFVTCYGLPFYAGWGLTQDRVVSPARTRRLDILDLIHGVLIRYPFYVSRNTGEYITPEQTLIELQQWREAPASWKDPIRAGLRKAINLVRGTT